MRPVQRLFTKKSGKIFQVGIFLDFVRRSGATRTEGPHGGASYARGANRIRIDPHWGGVARPWARTRRCCCTILLWLSSSGVPDRTKKKAVEIFKWVFFFGWGFFFLDFARSPARTEGPHGAYVCVSGRNRIDPHRGGGIERPWTRTEDDVALGLDRARVCQGQPRELGKRLGPPARLHVDLATKKER